jgi:hypothetical protein
VRRTFGNARLVVHSTAEAAGPVGAIGPRSVLAHPKKKKRISFHNDDNVAVKQKDRAVPAVIAQ